MGFHVLIPARLSSTRLPAKPLADLGGAPMVVRVAQRALLSGAETVCVAADHPSIVEACQDHAIHAILTNADHLSGSDRLAQACQLLGMKPTDVVVNVQGDEPLIEPDLIRSVADCLLHDQALNVATAATPIHDVESWTSPHIVKVVLSQSGRAMYFSRSPIPCWRDAALNAVEHAGLMPTSGQSVLRHIGLYAYRVKALLEFSQWPACALENTEALEQLRLLWHGQSIQVFVTDESPHAGVDTPADLARVREVWRKLGE